jgi:serine/threonine protein kinase
MERSLEGGAVPRPCPRCGSKISAKRVEGRCPRCLAAREPPSFVLAGKFELGDEIGEGGMATVYRARDRELGRDVAVKILREELANDERFRARFEREAKAQARLSHPGIVTIYETGFEDGIGFIAMELVTGGRLAARSAPRSRARSRPRTQAASSIATSNRATSSSTRRVGSS